MGQTCLASKAFTQSPRTNTIRLCLCLGRTFCLDFDQWGVARIQLRF
jgi:hypothetical protein